MMIKDGGHYCGLPARACVEEKKVVCFARCTPITFFAGLSFEYSSAAGKMESK